MTKDLSTWTEKEWLCYLLLSAIDADGNRHPRELRYLRLHAGEEVLGNVQELYDSLREEERADLLKKGIGIFLLTKAARAEVQKQLRDIFLADGEYGQEEQEMTQKIGNWIRENLPA